MVTYLTLLVEWQQWHPTCKILLQQFFPWIRPGHGLSYLARSVYFFTFRLGPFKRLEFQVLHDPRLCGCSRHNASFLSPRRLDACHWKSICCRLIFQPVSPKWSSKNLSPKLLVVQTSVHRTGPLILWSGLFRWLTAWISSTIFQSQELQTRPLACVTN